LPQQGEVDALDSLGMLLQRLLLVVAVAAVGGFGPLLSEGHAHVLAPAYHTNGRNCLLR